MRKFPITVTSEAWSKIIDISKVEGIQRFLFSATSGGCNGFNYSFTLLDNSTRDEIYRKHFRKTKPTILAKDNAEILVDPLSEMLLFGTTIDYVSEDYSNGVFENKFVFTHDKTLASACGCGTSFTPKSYSSVVDVCDDRPSQLN